MESASHRVGDERASVPRIVLPITSRGLEVTDRLCWGILAVAMAVAAGLILYLNRGATFGIDELRWVYATPGMGVSGVFEPHNGNLIATTRFAYKAILEISGTGYLPFRVLGTGAVLLSAGLFYALVKRRIGALPALAPALVLLFFGSAASYIVTPVGFTALFSISAGFGALLCLERDDRRGDVAACALLVVSIATFTTGLAFLIAVAISVILRDDRRARAWIFVVPLVLYAVWWVWSLSQPGSPEGQATASNVLLIPGYVADAAAAAAAALTGLDYGFGESRGPSVELEWGRILVMIGAIALGVRMWRRGVPRSLWASLGLALGFWVIAALGFSALRPPDATRYAYMGAVAVLLVATDAARSVRFTRLGLGVLFGVCVISLATNLALLRSSGVAYRNLYTLPARAQFAMVDLARDHVSTGFRPGLTVPGAGAFSLLPDGAGAYLAVSDRYGSLGLPLSDLGRQTEVVREGADQVLAGALALETRRARTAQATGPCERFSGDAATIELPPGGAALRVQGEAPAKLRVGRFASAATVRMGALAPGTVEALAIPTDASPTPWKATVEGARSVAVCELD